MTKKASFDFLRRVLTKCGLQICILPDPSARVDMGLRDMLGQGSGSARRWESDILRERVLYSHRDGFGCRYMFFRTDGRVVCIGPWLQEDIGESFPRELARRIGDDPATADRLRRYYASLPRLGQDSPLFVMVQAFLEELWRDGYERETFSPGAIPGYSPPVRKALLYIESSLGGELNLRVLAREINVNPSYLSDLFKKETGKTLTEYINRTRVIRARRLLRETTLQVQAVAQHCGIHDVNYFSKVFKKYTGKTPLQYRKEN